MLKIRWSCDRLILNKGIRIPGKDRLYTETGPCSFGWYSEGISIMSQGAVSIRKTVLLGMVIPMLKIRRPTGRLIFNMGIPIPGKTVFYIETGPWCYSVYQWPCVKAVTCPPMKIGIILTHLTHSTSLCKHLGLYGGCCCRQLSKGHSGKGLG